MKKNIAATALLTTIGGLALHASPESESQLDNTTILANRSLTDLSKVGNSVTILDAGLLEREGIRSVDQALKFVPGITSDSIGGQRGSTSDLYIRGLRTAHTHIVVDGMRISDTNSGLVLSKQFLGSNNLSGLSRLEILRGPQGALHGADSIGGVLGLYSKQGEGSHSGSYRVEGGSFNSWNTTLSVQGSDHRFSYALTLGRERTNNDLPHNTFEMDSYALRLDYEINDRLTIGMTLRGADSKYEGPQVGFGIDDTSFRYTLGTLFAEYQPNDIWISKLTLGIFDQKSKFVSPTFINHEALTKYGVYWDNTIKWNDRHTTVTGLVYEKSDYLYTDSFAGFDNRSRKQHGVYVNHTWDVTGQFSISGGLRWEEYSDDAANGFNEDVVTWRVASTYTCEHSGTTFRGSIGHGFRIPSHNELNGNPAFGVTPNPNLDPVESLGWDFGVEQAFHDGQYKVGVTCFGNRLESAIINPNGTGYVNTSGISETSGIEASVKAHFLEERLNIALTYTWLDRALVDIPENTVGLRIHGKVTDRLQAGLTATYLDNRSYGGNPLDSYYLANLYANYKITENVALNLRAENLFDQNYQYFNGFGSTYPGRGRGIFGGVLISW